MTDGTIKLRLRDVQYENPEDDEESLSDSKHHCVDSEIRLGGGMCPEVRGKRTAPSLCLLFNSSAGTSSRRALKAEMRARTNDEIM